MLIKCETSELEKDTSVQDITVRITSYFDEVIFKILYSFKILGFLQWSIHVFSFFVEFKRNIDSSNLF